jgi:hypothetical protein
MTRIHNLPIPGHHLIDEGKVYPDHSKDRMYSYEPIEYKGGCKCGAKPPGFPHVSSRAMKAWHRKHKDEVRGIEAATVYYTVPAPSYVWCDVHGEIHRDRPDVHDEGMEECDDKHWRPVYVQTSDPSETF